MDGFLIRRKFYCKELGVLEIGGDNARSHFFDLEINWDDLSEKDKKTCAYTMKYIHKLPFEVPEGVRAYKQSQLEDIIVKFYNEVKQSKNSTIAYKGGHFEKDLLKKLRIPHINLEIFGCPKANQLFEKLI